MSKQSRLNELARSRGYRNAYEQRIARARQKNPNARLTELRGHANVRKGDIPLSIRKKFPVAVTGGASRVERIPGYGWLADFVRDKDDPVITQAYYEMLRSLDKLEHSKRYRKAKPEHQRAMRRAVVGKFILFVRKYAAGSEDVDFHSFNYPEPIAA